ncbi:hypothetical protein PIB30_075860 [Stylosanthes scabra]|uniref:Protein FAR1-RELATED SEQUENCE n=1 Tax=Stylosanthes scabra TaxID=79078 RepID=A0ABU6XN20_9FABA|nr:hypothetical protein [Stylosanthes scabra]
MKRIVWESRSIAAFESDRQNFIQEYDLYSSRAHSVAFFDKYITNKSSLIQFVRQYQNCLIDKEQKELECDADDLRGLLPCVSSSPIEKQFQKKYTNNLFRKVQEQFLKKADCFLTSVIHQGTRILCQVDQQRMVPEMSVYTQDFATNIVEANILRAAIDSAPSKLKKHKESNRKVVPLTSGINFQTNEECPIAIDEIRGRHRVPTRGRPSTTRLGAALDNSIKKSVRKRKHKHADEHNEEAS